MKIERYAVMQENYCFGRLVKDSGSVHVDGWLHRTEKAARNDVDPDNNGNEILAKITIEPISRIRLSVIEEQYVPPKKKARKKHRKGDSAEG